MSIYSFITLSFTHTTSSVPSSFHITSSSHSLLYSSGATPYTHLGALRNPVICPSKWQAEVKMWQRLGVSGRSEDAGEFGGGF
jgi:hypothetical protein